MIKDLYDKVELFLSKHNTEEFFQAFPERRKPFLYQKNYLIIRRARKAVMLLTKEYGGKILLRLMLFLLFLTAVMAIYLIVKAIIFLRQCTYTFDDIKKIVQQASDLSISVTSIVTLVLTVVVPYVRLFCLTVINNLTSRGDAIKQGAASIKDSIGFLQSVGKNDTSLQQLIVYATLSATFEYVFFTALELADLFEFLKLYQKVIMIFFLFFNSWLYIN